VPIEGLASSPHSLHSRKGGGGKGGGRGKFEDDFDDDFDDDFEVDAPPPKFYNPKTGQYEVEGGVDVNSMSPAPTIQPAAFEKGKADPPGPNTPPQPHDRLRPPPGLSPPPGLHTPEVHQEAIEPTGWTEPEGNGQQTSKPLNQRLRSLLDGIALLVEHGLVYIDVN
jgi:hypothetical protein